MGKKLRGSELNDFLRCRTKWHYAWNERLTPKTPNTKLFVGSLLHKFLEYLYKYNEVPSGLRAMRELYETTDTGNADPLEMQELIGLCEQIANNYTKQWRIADAEYTVVATELQFAIPVTDELTYTGTIDLVLKDKDGRIWFMDHKTTNNIESYEKRVDMDRQISRYWWALQQLGYDVAGFIYNIILKDIPEPPSVLKNGTLSKNKAQKTTYKMYMDAIMDNLEDSNDYQEILDHLKAQETENGNRFFRRVKVTRLQPEIDNAIEEMVEVAKDMKDARVYRNITKDCSWDCPFQSICVAGMDGSNVDYLKGQLFEEQQDYIESTTIEE